MFELLDFTLLKIGNFSLKLSNILSLLIFIIFVFLFIKIIKKLIYRSRKIDNAKKFSIIKLFQYVIVSLSFIAGLSILGFNITVLLAGSAALLVGLGFGLQHLFSDFISGVILLLDGTIKMDDIIEVNGVIYKVQDINFRTTTVIGRNEDYVILPNTELISNKVVNWTHSEVSSRFKVAVGVDYGTDVDLLKRILKEAVVKHPEILQNPEPFIRFEDFGDSALLFSVFFYTNEIFRVERIKSEIRFDILKVLRDHNINIPFPQRVVHQAK